MTPVDPPAIVRLRPALTTLAERHGFSPSADNPEWNGKYTILRWCRRGSWKADELRLGWRMPTRSYFLDASWSVPGSDRSEVVAAGLSASYARRRRTNASLPATVPLLTSWLERRWCDAALADAQFAISWLDRCHSFAGALEELRRDDRNGPRPGTDAYQYIEHHIQRLAAERSSLIPMTIRTTRLLLRPWSASDAPALYPILLANAAHLGPWIPEHVATAVPVEELSERLAGFAADFEAHRSYRYALLADGTRLVGEADLFPRAGAGRVPLDSADHVELGYWLDAAATGHGFATEATQALFNAATVLPGMTHVEIRCEAANTPSAAIPQRLGFQLASVEGDLQIWRKPLRR